jgi:hypothetical protein
MRTARNAKQEIFPIAVILLSTHTVWAANEQKRDLGVALDVTYMSKYIDKGGRYFGSKSAIVENLDIDLYGTGLGLLVHNRRANSSGYENREKFKYGAYYRDSLFDGEPHNTTYRITWYYHNYVDEPRDKANKHEWIFDFAWPELLPGGPVPRYTAWYMYPAGSGWENSDVTGWLHRVELGYDLTISELPEQVFHLFASSSYNDGLGSGRDHDWAFGTFGVSTKLKLTESLSFIPALYYQSSWEDTVNEHDELYCRLCMRYKF